MAMAAGGKTQEQISRVIGTRDDDGVVRGISETTLREHFATELAKGKDHVDAICITGLVAKMQAGDLGAICFYAKTRMGWREKNQTDMRFVDGEGNDRDISTAKQELAAELTRIAARTATE
jgi:hypothetical protein